jgi:bacterioferritin-associated ferredoxin
MIVCVCKRVTEAQLAAAAARGATSQAELAEATGAGSECGACIEELARRAEASRAIERIGGASAGSVG